MGIYEGVLSRRAVFGRGFLMITVTVGSQKFPFDRLIEKVDALVQSGAIKDKVFAQIGAGTYRPKSFEYKDFVSSEELSQRLARSDIVITHGGIGIIVTALKCGKKVIAVPRLEKFGEHVDDHQIQIIKKYDKLNYIEPCYDIEDLEKSLENIKTKKYADYNNYTSGAENIIQSIREFIGD